MKKRVVDVRYIEFDLIDDDASERMHAKHVDDVSYTTYIHTYITIPFSS